MNNFHDLLKSHNLSVTATRLAILQAIQEHPHTEADKILHHARQKSGALSKQAVYDNLHAMSANGILRAIQPMGHSARYEIHKHDNHHHLVCRSCGVTVDVECIKGARPCLAPAEEHGFDLDEAEVIFWGICPSCQSKSKPTGESHG